MALQGTFLADFTQFSAAVRDADVELKGFEADSNKVASSLSRMTNSFTGQHVVQQATLMAEAVERVGGTSTLTAAELARVGNVAKDAADKLRAVGADVPQRLRELEQHATGATNSFGTMLGTVTKLAGAFGIAFSVGSVVNFGKELFASTARLNELSQTTGVSTDAIQRMQYVMADFGVDTETIARAIGTLSTRIGSGDAGVAQAVTDLGLSLSMLQSMSPEDAFLAIAEAAGRVENPMTKADLVSAAFGERLGRVLIPALGDLRTGMDNVPKGAIISQATIQSASDFDAALKRITQSFKAAVAEGIQADVRGLTRVWAFLTGDAETFTAAVNQSSAALSLMASHGTADLQLMSSHGMKPLISDADIMRQRLESWRSEGVEPLNEAQREAIRLGTEKHKSDALIAETIGVSVGAVKQYVAVLKEQEGAQNRIKEAIDRMIGSQKTYLDLILPGTSKLAELERSRAEQAGQTATFTAEGLKNITFLEQGLGQVQEIRATGAMAIHLAEQTAIREQAEALALVEQQMTDNFIVVGQSGQAHQSAGDTAVAATNAATQGYATLAAGIGSATQQAERFIVSHRQMMDLGEAARQLNHGRATSTQEALLKGFEIVTARGGGIGASGGGSGVNMQNTFNIVDTADNIARRVTDSLAQQMLQGRKMG